MTTSISRFIKKNNAYVEKQTDHTDTPKVKSALLVTGRLKITKAGRLAIRSALSKASSNSGGVQTDYFQDEINPL